MAAVKEAFDRGINFFDTSPFYGDTRSETVGGTGGRSALRGGDNVAITSAVLV